MSITEEANTAKYHADNTGEIGEFLLGVALGLAMIDHEGTEFLYRMDCS